MKDLVPGPPPLQALEVFGGPDYNPEGQTGNSKLLAPLVYHHYITGTSQNYSYSHRKVVNILPS